MPGLGPSKHQEHGICRRRPFYWKHYILCFTVLFHLEHSVLFSPADAGFQARVTHFTLASPSPGRAPWLISDSPRPKAFNGLLTSVPILLIPSPGPLCPRLALLSLGDTVPPTSLHYSRRIWLPPGYSNQSRFC